MSFRLVRSSLGFIVRPALVVLVGGLLVLVLIVGRSVNSAVAEASRPFDPARACARRGLDVGPDCDEVLAASRAETRPVAASPPQRFIGPMGRADLLARVLGSAPGVLGASLFTAVVVAAEWPSRTVAWRAQMRRRAGPPAFSLILMVTAVCFGSALLGWMILTVVLDGQSTAGISAMTTARDLGVAAAIVATSASVGAAVGSTVRNALGAAAIIIVGFLLLGTDPLVERMGSINPITAVAHLMHFLPGSGSTADRIWPATAQPGGSPASWVSLAAVAAASSAVVIGRFNVVDRPNRTWTKPQTEQSQ